MVRSQRSRVPCVPGIRREPHPRSSGAQHVRCSRQRVVSGRRTLIQDRSLSDNRTVQVARDRKPAHEGQHRGQRSTSTHSRSAHGSAPPSVEVTQGIAEVALANTRRRAARRRHSLTRRCIVLSSSSEKVPGASAWRRWSNPFAVASGSDSSHVTTRGHTASNGSLRVRQWRCGFGPARCVGRTSPSFHAEARLCS